MNALLVVTMLIGLSFALWRIGRRFRFFLHTFQLFGYKRKPYQAWIGTHVADVVVRPSHAVGAVLLLVSNLVGVPDSILFAGTDEINKRSRSFGRLGLNVLA